MKRLTPKQRAFCDYYIETGNASESYRRAGYTAKGQSAEVNASRLLSNAKVREYIAERMREKDNQRIASQDEILEFITRVMRGEVTEQVPVVMQEYFEMADKAPSIKDRTKAAELLGKRYMMWTEKQSVDANMLVTFIEDLDD